MVKSCSIASDEPFSNAHGTRRSRWLVLRLVVWLKTLAGALEIPAIKWGFPRPCGESLAVDLCTLRGLITRELSLWSLQWYYDINYYQTTIYHCHYLISIALNGPSNCLIQKLRAPHCTNLKDSLLQKSSAGLGIRVMWDQIILSMGPKKNPQASYLRHIPEVTARS